MFSVVLNSNGFPHVGSVLATRSHGERLIKTNQTKRAAAAKNILSIHFALFLPLAPTLGI